MHAVAPTHVTFPMMFHTCLDDDCCVGPASLYFWFVVSKTTIICKYYVMHLFFAGGTITHQLYFSFYLPPHWGFQSSVTNLGYCIFVDCGQPAKNITQHINAVEIIPDNIPCKISCFSEQAVCKLIAPYTAWKLCICATVRMNVWKHPHP